MLIDLQRDGRIVQEPDPSRPRRDLLGAGAQADQHQLCRGLAVRAHRCLEGHRGGERQADRRSRRTSRCIGKRVEFCPSLWGGKDWPSAAYSQKTKLVYVPANENFCGGFTGEKVPLKPGELWLGTKPEDIGLTPRPGADHFGELQAWDPATGKKVWSHNFPTVAAVRLGDGDRR